MVDKLRCILSYDSPQGVVFKYERYDGVEVFLGDVLIEKSQDEEK